MWGNEPDFWRYGKPKFMWPLPTYIFAAVWFVLFTIGGWMMLTLAGDADPFNFSVHYSLFGAFWLAWIIATISQFAINDGNYYESVNAGQNLLGGWRHWKRVYTCVAVAGGGALAAWIVNYKAVNGWFDVATFLAITVPCATMIMVVDHFVLPERLRISRPLLEVPSWQEAGRFNAPAVVSLLVAVAYGAIASAILPGNLGYDTARNWGPVPVECWLLAGGLYLGIVWALQHSPNIKRILAFSKPALETSVPLGAVADIASEAEEGPSGEAQPVPAI
jgi:cytosine permease